MSDEEFEDRVAETINDTKPARVAGSEYLTCSTEHVLSIN